MVSLKGGSSGPSEPYTSSVETCRNRKLFRSLSGSPRPVRSRLFQQREGPIDIGANEVLGSTDRAVHVAFRCEMHNRAWLVLFQQLPDETAIADIAVNEFIPPICSDAFQIVQVPRVSQFIQIHDATTDSSCICCRTKLDPMKPAPPVTRIVFRMRNSARFKAGSCSRARCKTST